MIDALESDDAVADMFDGYRDGLSSTQAEVSEGVNRSEAYVFGWRNGRDDRMGKPRATAEVLRAMGENIIEQAASL